MNDEQSTLHAGPVRLGRYQLLRRIGRGGMGEVWLAEDPRLHRHVAIKMLPFNKQTDLEFLQRFEREAQAAAALNHPHILPIHDFGEETLPSGQAITFIVMPYIAGGTLSDRIKLLAGRGTPMQPEEAGKFLMQAAEAIDYAHGQHVVHRDIKPVNMLLRDDNWLLLADFGIARILSSTDNITQAGIGVGTPEYMAPEQAQGKAEAASDTYSLAVIAYQLLTGKLPFQADTPYATTIQHIITPPPPPRSINPHLSEATERVLLYGLAKEPARRPPSSTAFVQDLQHSLADSASMPTYISQTVPQDREAYTPTAISRNPITPPPPLTPGTGQSLPLYPAEQTAPRRGLTRRQLLIGGSGAAVLLAGGLGTWAVISSSHASQTNATPTPTAAKATPNADQPAMTLVAHTAEVSSLAWSPKTNILASGGKDGSAMLWDVAAIHQGQDSTTRPKTQQTFTINSRLLLGWSPDGANIAIGNSNSQLNAKDSNVVDTITDVYTSDLNKRISTYNSQLMTFFRTTYIQSLVWAPGNYLVTVSHPHETTGSGEYLLEFRDPLHPEKGLVSTHQFGFDYALAASPDGTTIAVGTGLGVMLGHLSGAGTNATWNETFPLLSFTSTDKKSVLPVGDVTWSPDGQYVAAITNPQLISSSQLAIWDWQSKQQTQLSLPSSSTLLTALSWSSAPSSKLLAAGSNDGGVSIWNVDLQNKQGNGLPTRNLSGLKAPVTSLAWSADGQWLAASYSDTNDSIVIWKI